MPFTNFVRLILIKPAETIFEGENMKDSTIITLALGMIIGAVTVSMCKPAQTAVRKGTEMVKDEAKQLINKVKKDNE